MPIYPFSKEEIAYHQKKMMCIDPSEFIVSGDYNSSKGNQLTAQFIKCNPIRNPDIECKSNNEIKRFIRGKYLILLFN